MLRLFVAAVAALTFAAAADAQGPLRRVADRVRDRFADPVTVAPTCTGPNCAVAFPQPMPGPGHVTHVAEAQAVAPAPKFVPVPGAPKVMKADPPAVAASDGKPGALFCVLVRAEARKAYRAQGHSFAESWRKAAELTDDVIAAAVPDAEKVAGVKVVGQLGDGSLLAALIEFLKSPQGQALIQALLKLLMGLI